MTALVFRRVALGAIASLALLAASPAFAETIGMMPIDYSKLQTSYYDGNDFTIRDKASKADWVFPSGDNSFHSLLRQLSSVSAGNVAQLAYVGNEGGTLPPHGAWVAPLGSDQRPSLVKGSLPGKAVQFNTSSLTVASAGAGMVALTDGKVAVATLRSGGEESLGALKTMLQKLDLNTAMQVGDGERAKTPVGENGPMIVFLKTTADGGEMTGATKTHEPRVCHWYSFFCKPSKG